MTLHKAGGIGGRGFAILHDEDGNEEKFVCLGCMAETVPEVEAFEQHKCSKAPPKALRPLKAKAEPESKETDNG